MVGGVTSRIVTANVHVDVKKYVFVAVMVTFVVPKSNCDPDSVPDGE